MVIPQFLVDYDAANVRLFFRIYFIVLGLTAGPLGNACSSVVARLRIAKRKNVSVPNMFGWLGGIDCLTAIWKTGAYPSGFLLTSLMLITFSISLASDLVSAYIRSISVHDRCVFGTGLVMQSNRGMEGPGNNGFPYTVVSQAQTISLANDGLQGIYAKVNQATDFSAAAVDVLGGWQCSQEPLELSYSPSEEPSLIALDLIAHGYLYDSDTVVEAWSTTHPLEHYVLIDVSNNGVWGTPWDFRASVSTYGTVNNTTTMLSFHCTLNDQVGWLNNISSSINAPATLLRWSLGIQGACYSGTGTPARPDLPGILERIFNSMIMIAGGGNSLIDSSQATSTQGCLTSRTWILWEVLALAGLAAVLNGFLVAYLVFLKLLEISARRRVAGQHDIAKELDKIPSGLIGWAVQAVRESHTQKGQPGMSDRTADVEAEDLKKWDFAWLGWGKRCGIVPSGHNVEEVQLLSNVAIQSYTPYHIFREDQ